MAEIAVVHLVRRANGLAPFERFLASYRSHPAGLDHDLVLLFKGFGFRRDTASYDRLLDGLPHRRLYVSDHGFDLRPYFVAVRRLEHRVLFFCNSFTRFLHDGWLHLMHRALQEPGVGLVGATGSWQSFTSANRERADEFEGLPFGERARRRWQHITSDPSPRMVVQRFGAWLLGAIGLWDPARHFPAFPNAHVRTNAFLARRETLARVRFGPLFFKLSAFMVESGRHSVTRQIRAMGLRPVLVGRDGNAYEMGDWDRSDTFRQADQQNLMIADNQTDAYARADAAQRAFLARTAWGDRARPQ